jgi:hypothetical protein
MIFLILSVLSVEAKKIRLETSYLHGCTEEYSPEFRSTPTEFHVIFKNMNYNLHGMIVQDTGQDKYFVNLRNIK